MKLPFSDHLCNVARSVQNGDHLQHGANAVNDQIRTDRPESYVPLREIGSRMPHPGPLSQHLECLEEFILQFVRSGDIV
ncbi:MAG: hypothetical protein WAM04_20945 [Candidatus Sulfotelmatobacter sp.]